MNELLEKYRNRESGDQNAERADKAKKYSLSHLARFKSTVTMRNLAAIAKGHSITQSAIAKQTGIAQNSLSATFKGKNAPQLDRVYLILDAVNELAGQKYTLSDVLNIFEPRGGKVSIVD